MIVIFSTDFFFLFRDVFMFEKIGMIVFGRSTWGLLSRMKRLKVTSDNNIYSNILQFQSPQIVLLETALLWIKKIIMSFTGLCYVCVCVCVCRNSDYTKLRRVTVSVCTVVCVGVTFHFIVLNINYCRSIHDIVRMQIVTPY